MTDIVQWLRDPHGKLTFQGGSPYAFKLADEIESLRQQLAECQAREKVLRDGLSIIRERLADDYDLHHNQFSSEFDVIEDALALPSDSTALDTMLAAAELKGRREALLEALTELQDNMTPGNSCYGEAYYDAQCSLCDDLRRMAKELK